MGHLATIIYNVADQWGFPQHGDDKPFDSRAFELVRRNTSKRTNLEAI